MSLYMAIRYFPKIINLNTNDSEVSVKISFHNYEEHMDKVIHCNIIYKSKKIKNDPYDHQQRPG